MPGTLLDSSVLEFYNDAKIFVTGATGFLGKALIDKMLRSCPNLSHIYLLIRVKKGKEPQERMKDIFADRLFNTLRKEKPDFEKKITCIPGAVNGKNLMMSANDYEFLVNEVTHVFHSAATVRFNEKLKSAIGTNVLGTNEILEFVNKCTRLKVFVHVSTTYAHCARKLIEEDFYDPPIPPEKALDLTVTFSEEKLNSMTDELVKPWPNTYSFTKAIAENIVLQKGKSIPAVVFRPGIIMGSSKEPVPGWIDNIYGPTGIIVAVGVGLMRVLYADETIKANIVPVDLTVNALMCCAWEGSCNFMNLATVKSSSSGNKGTVGAVKKVEVTPKVYNFIADNDNVITWGEFRKINLTYGIKSPSEKAIWFYTLTLTKTKMIYLSLIFLYHYVPAAIGDAVLMLLGKKPQMIKAYRKIHVFSDVMVVFAINKWKFTNPNIKKLWSRINDADKKIFDFDMKKVEWNEYLAGVVSGIRNYILNETEQALPAARRRMFLLWLGHRLIQLCFVLFCFWILSKVLFTFDDWRTHLKSPIVMPPNLLRNST